LPLPILGVRSDLGGRWRAKKGCSGDHGSFDPARTNSGEEVFQKKKQLGAALRGNTQKRRERELKIEEKPESLLSKRDSCLHKKGVRLPSEGEFSMAGGISWREPTGKKGRRI